MGDDILRRALRRYAELCRSLALRCRRERADTIDGRGAAWWENEALQAETVLKALEGKPCRSRPA